MSRDTSQDVLGARLLAAKEKLERKLANRKGFLDVREHLIEGNFGLLSVYVDDQKAYKEIVEQCGSPFKGFPLECVLGQQTPKTPLSEQDSFELLVAAKASLGQELQKINRVYVVTEVLDQGQYGLFRVYVGDQQIAGQIIKEFGDKYKGFPFEFVVTFGPLNGYEQQCMALSTAKGRFIAKFGTEQNGISGYSVTFGQMLDGKPCLCVPARSGKCLAKLPESFEGVAIHVDS